MKYLVNQARLATLNIGGIDYSSKLISLTVSDSSAFKNGFISTTGTIVLGQILGATSIEDYDRNNFKRANLVTIDVKMPDGSTVRHPRGYLYVISTSWNTQEGTVSIEVGCKLAMYALLDDVSQLLPLSPVQLDPAQQTYQAISAAFASYGKYLYQNNQGNLVSGFFFETDSSYGTMAGEWISVLGVTALNVSPLSAADPIPDIIELSYQVPIPGGVSVDNTGKVDLSENKSTYYLSYPGVTFIRASDDGKLPGELSGTSGASASGGGSCGNDPPEPAAGPSNDGSCNDNYSAEQSNITISAVRLETSRSEYNAVGGQLSRKYTETTGPLIEANQQYFADYYAWCKSANGTFCNPNGGCNLFGTETGFLSSSEQLNYYSTDGSLTKTVTDSYENYLSAASTEDWRSGTNNGVPQGFQTLSTTQKYRSRSVIQEYYQEGIWKVTKTTTYTSAATQNGAGLKANIDAMAGIKTVEESKSTTITTTPIAPDRVNSPTSSTEEVKIELIVNSDVDLTLFTQPYKVKEQIPIPLIYASISSVVNTYSNYLLKFIKGDAYGLQIAECLSEPIVTNWRPGMPFRYCDPSQNKLIAMRMDACTWSVSQNENIVATNGVWVGFSNGTVSYPSNLVGDSRPDMGSGTTPPVGPGQITVDNETVVNTGNYAAYIDVNMTFSSLIGTNGDAIYYTPAESIYDSIHEQTFTCYVSGLIVTQNDILNTGPNGYIPLEYNGVVLTATATVVDPDIFS